MLGLDELVSGFDALIAGDEAKILVVPNGD